MPLPTLQTARLILRPWTLADIDELHALWIRPEVRRYLWDDEVITRARAEETVRDLIALQESDGIGGWVVLDNATGALAGFVGLIRREPGETELLYGLGREWWGRGLATEASMAVLTYAFAELRCARVTAATDVPNVASVRVMQRLGMRFTHRAPLNGLDTLFYELRREDFATEASTARR